MKKIKEWIKSFINKYIVSEDPNDSEVEEVFQARLKEYDEWETNTKPKRKRGRPKKTK